MYFNSYDEPLSTTNLDDIFEENSRLRNLNKNLLTQIENMKKEKS